VPGSTRFARGRRRRAQGAHRRIPSEPGPEASPNSALGADSGLSPPIFAHQRRVPLRRSTRPEPGKNGVLESRSRFYDGSRRSVNRKHEVACPLRALLLPGGALLAAVRRHRGFTPGVGGFGTSGRGSDTLWCLSLIHAVRRFPGELSVHRGGLRSRPCEGGLWLVCVRNGRRRRPPCGFGARRG